ncbi:hypothetical protein BWQ96_07151 [Gracilariopsis chorda]|uniref:Uncharacterized protein n=1 Tax=Gracilariopsis chorda TaxID=448386 RepID=A0A2V3IM50_9FLOR|nr:hypothetical protein BWQ96_07151 [Gracilariopsis chorda]|eukprot:PXF43117.1 hypothetical protein BWQ96_07151 [Gracilariopsis chorda]
MRSKLVLDGFNQFYPNPKLALEDPAVQEVLEDRFESLQMTSVAESELEIRRTYPFLKFMYIVAMENDIMLDFEDYRLLSEMDDVLEFPTQDSSRQLDRYGISVEFFEEGRESESESDVISFRYGPHEHLVGIVPSSPNAVGFSIMSFIITPNHETADVFLKFVEISRMFQNCFVDMLKRELRDVLQTLDIDLRQTHNDDVPYKEVVIPWGWAYHFKIDFEFLKEHGKVGSVGICGVSLFGFGAKLNATPNGTISSQREKVLRAENTVVFLSFEHFFTFDFRESEQNGLIKRMLWFIDAMQAKNVFPRGENQDFLKALSNMRCT